MIWVALAIIQQDVVVDVMWECYSLLKYRYISYQ